MAAAQSRINTLISIHALREEGDLQEAAADLGGKLFLSTPSARRATVDGVFKVFPCLFLSTPSARRATARATIHRYGRLAISIHALREEGDYSAFFILEDFSPFLSTPSARRATPPTLKPQTV